jgi:hypothetical protein
MLRRWSAVGVVFAVVLCVAGCSSSSGKSAGPTTTTRPAPATEPAPWPAPKPSDAMALARAAGLRPRGYETLQHHVHAHLDVFVDGVHEIVPAGIGININDPAVHTGEIAGGPAYGGISPPCKQACISPLHTHAQTGILHTESPTNVDNTLGELFIEWGVTLNNKCVGGYCSPAWKIAYYVDGKPYTGDPLEMTLTNFKEIAIVIGNPPAHIPSTADFTTD